MVGVSGKVGRDRTPPLLEWNIREKEMLAVPGVLCPFPIHTKIDGLQWSSFFPEEHR
jgi:hypothetical protein